MNSLIIIALVFLFGASSSQAMPYMVEGNIASGLAEASVASVKKVVEKQNASDDKGTEYLQATMKTNPLYPLLLALETEMPQITKTLEFIVMFNEVRELNQKLTLLVQQMQQNNAQLTGKQTMTNTPG